MSDIYTRAYVTLEAASASKPSEGFLNTRDSFKPYVELEWRRKDLRTTVEAVQLRPIDDVRSDRADDMQIFSRGWALQGRLPAPRTLSFGKRLISYECIESLRDETEILSQIIVQNPAWHDLRKDNMDLVRQQQQFPFPWIRALFSTLAISDPIPTPWGRLCFLNTFQLPGLGRNSTCYDFWKMVIRKFSGRHLTMMEDRLPALSGLAREIQKATKDTYCAGHWRSDLLVSLSWTAEPAIKADSDVGRSAHHSVDLVFDWLEGLQPSVYIAPSWSWAPVRTPVDYSDPSDYAPLAKIVDVQTTPKFQDPLGCLSAGHIDIVGPLLRIPTVLYACDPAYPFAALHAAIRSTAVQSTLRTQTLCVENHEESAEEFYQHHRSHANQEFAVLKILHWKDFSDSENWLLLETCVDGTWRRLCLLPQRLKPYNWSRHKELQTGDVGLDRTSIEDYQAALAAELGRGQEYERVREDVLAAPWKKEKIRLT